MGIGHALSISINAFGGRESFGYRAVLIYAILVKPPDGRTITYLHKGCRKVPRITSRASIFWTIVARGIGSNRNGDVFQVTAYRRLSEK